MWKDVVLFGIPAYLALVLSVSLFVQDRLRYHIKLRLIVAHAVVVWNKDNQSLVLFRLTFVNHSLRGQIVATTSIKTQQDIIYEPFVYFQDETYQKVKFPVPDDAPPFSLPVDEVLHDALDIPPQQSRSKWNGVLLEWQESSLGDWPLPFWFYAHDINGKELVRCGITLTLKQLKNPDFYSLSKYVQVKT